MPVWLMPVTNPWLAGPAPTRRLDRERLEERILNLLSAQNMCVLATSGPAGPLATPVRYFHLDFTVIFTAAPDSPKMRNLAAADHAFYWQVVRWQSAHVERSRPLDQPPAETLGVVLARRVVYTEHWLRRDGYAPRQFWQAPDSHVRSDSGRP